MKGIWMMFVVLSMSFTLGAQKKKELTTAVNVNYCLPKVVYDIEVELECAQCIPGPYHHYAQKELGLTPEITSPKQEWSIKKIQVKPRSVPDEKAVYAVSAGGDYLPVLLSLSAEAFLAGVSAGESGIFNAVEKKDYVSPATAEQREINIMKFNTYNHLKEVLDTNYTYQEIDGVMKKIWDPIVRYTPKTETDNVKEVVSEIFRIRSERVKLLGAENNVPDGKSLEIILKEFDRMEADYLSLFMGRKEKYYIKQVFSCTPEKASEPVVAFRFSENEGISGTKNVTTQPYMLRIENVVVPASTPVDGESGGAAIYYRIPATGELELLKGKEVLLTMPVIVPQLGEIKKFPVDIISNEGLSIEFYPQYGALRSVKKK